MRVFNTRFYRTKKAKCHSCHTIFVYQVRVPESCPSCNSNLIKQFTNFYSRKNNDLLKDQEILKFNSKVIDDNILSKDEDEDWIESLKRIEM
jgi:hypothetical protein